MRDEAGGVLTSARHELKADVVELLLGVPESQDEADGNAGVGHGWILVMKKLTLGASSFPSTLCYSHPLSCCFNILYHQHVLVVQTEQYNHSITIQQRVSRLT